MYELTFLWFYNFPKGPGKSGLCPACHLQKELKRSFAQESYAFFVSSNFFFPKKI